MATILIVEDDIDTNEALSEYLGEAGHQTISAYDGEEAISLFSENSIQENMATEFENIFSQRSKKLNVKV